MKPRIRRFRGAWTCAVPLIGVPVVYGDGPTPKEAYQRWFAAVWAHEYGAATPSFIEKAMAWVDRLKTGKGA